jgi:hypothetical protein
MPFKVSKYQLGDQPIQFTLPQLLAIMAPQKHRYLEWSRGAGKSTVLAWSIKEKPLQMPRGSFFLVGETYNQILTRTLPGTINGLEKLGYKKDIHFFVGRKAPVKWKWNEPYEPPLNYDHAIHWVSGAVTHLISLDMPNSGRGLNTDGGDGDEAALFDYDKLFANVLTTNRGNIDRFGKCPLHHSLTFASSVPMTNKGKWLYKMEEEAKKEPNRILYLRANSEHNRHNLGDDWFDENKRIMTPLIYNAEILNIRPDRVDGGFYPQFNESLHTADFYDNSFLLKLGHDFDKAKSAGCLADGDLRRNQPIHIALDYGSNINTIHSEQEYDGTSHGLSSMFIKSPETLDVLINKYCDYYSAQQCKIVHYHYDHTAVATTANSRVTFKDTVIETFNKRGWSVVEHYHGKAPSHHSKFLFWSTFLKGTDTRLPRYMLNKSNCKYMIVSMQQAGVIQSRNGFEKDKRPEKQKNAVDEETTHFSDAGDTLYYFKYSPRLSNSEGDYSLPKI